MKKILMVLALLAGSVLLAAPATQAVDTSGDHKVCTKKVIDKAAFDEVVPGTPSQWWNWSPNDNQEPFDGPPAFPDDERGTWQGPHTEGGPGQDLVGTYQASDANGRSDWFHREPATEDRTIHHDATFKTVEVPCDDGSVKDEQKEVEPATLNSLPQTGA